MRHLCFYLSGLLLAAPLASTSPYLAPAQGDAQPRPWRRFSDSIIRRIWGVPNKQTYISSAHLEAQTSNDVPSRKLIARYGDDVVLRFNISTTEEASALGKASNDLFLDVWEFNENWVDIRLSKDVIPSLLGLLPESLHNSHVALMQDLDLARAVFESFPSSSATSPTHKSFSPSLHHTTTDGHDHQPHTSQENTNLFFHNYQPLSVITPWLSLMSSMFPTHVRLTHIGFSYEGREIPALRVGVHPTNSARPPTRRKTILIVGGSHAREWISTSTVNYLAWSLITKYGKNPQVTRFVELFDWVFVPTLNPDGYAYSWETDRLWRKNRQPTSLRFCRGLDIDRSFPFQWSTAASATRDNPCSEAYAGDSPWEAVESKRLADWARNETAENDARFVALLDLHSYSQQVLYPYAYSCDARPPRLENLEELALGLAKAIRVSHAGHRYIAASACEGNVVSAITASSSSSSSAFGDGGEVKKHVRLPRMESAGGSLLDYFHHDLRLPYAYQIKLRDTGNYGFLLPRENIVPTGEEVFAALTYLGRYLDGQIGLDDNDDDDRDGRGEIRGEDATDAPPAPPLEPLDRDAERGVTTVVGESEDEVAVAESPFDDMKERGAGVDKEALEL